MDGGAFGSDAELLSPDVSVEPLAAVVPDDELVFVVALPEPVVFAPDAVADTVVFCCCAVLGVGALLPCWLF